VIDAATSLRSFRNELRQNEAVYLLSRGFHG
jgi:hypothetical protein